MDAKLRYEKKGSGYVTLSEDANAWQEFKLCNNFGEVVHPYFRILGKRALIRPFYYWDGATMIPDTKKLMTPSLIHDMLYQIAREGAIPSKFSPEEFIHLANKEFKEQYLANGGYKWYSWVIFQGVEKFGKRFAKSRVLHAPKLV